VKPYYSDELTTIYHGDCREVLPFLSADALVTDPPYGIGAAKAKAHSSIRNNDDWPKAEWDEVRCEDALLLALSRCKDAAIWGGNFYADVLAASAGWLVWVKPQADSGFSLADCELCWTNREIAARVRRAPRRDGNVHPTQKPVTIMDWTLSFMRGSTVLDPFMGSGTTLVAAKQLGRPAIGIDIEERYCELAANRLAQGVLFGEIA
jgi:DNA modification methylase